MRTMASAQVTELLHAWGAGDETALHQLVPLWSPNCDDWPAPIWRASDPGIRCSRRRGSTHFLRLVDVRGVRWHGRAHFFGIARSSDAPCARRPRQSTRFPEAWWWGTDRAARDDDPSVSCTGHRPARFDHALDALAEVDDRKARVVEMRFFGGMTVEETAAALGVSGDTVKRDWRLAKLWLLKTLGEQAR